jgi:signal peptidase I
MARARPRKSARAERGSLLRLVIIVALVAWLVRSLVFAPFSIPSGSMLPTLLIGDYVIVAKWPYGFSRFSFPLQFPPFDGRIASRLPARGDVVVFRPAGGGTDDFVKRVIGLPGDTVEVRGGALILNGRPVQRGPINPVAIPISSNSPCRVVAGATPAVRASGGERACVYPGFRETLPNGASYAVIDQEGASAGDSFPATMVPAGHVFLMGDNRDDSLDSRFSPFEGGIGLVPVDRLIGRASVIAWSTDGSASYLKPWTWFTAFRTGRIGTSLSAGAR